MGELNQSLKAASESRGSRILVGAIVFAPLVAHVVLCVKEAPFRLWPVDYVVLLLAVSYAAVAVAALARRALALRLVALVYTVALGVAAVELFLHLRTRWRTSGLPKEPTALVSTANDTMPGISGEIRYTVNSLGLRGPQAELGSADVRILFVGGSSVECLYVTDEKSFPWLLGSRLSRSLGRPVYVGNAGKAGHIVLNHDYLLRRYKHAGQFGWVAVMCGMNDMGTLLRGDYLDQRALVPDLTMAQPTDGGNMPASGPYYKRLGCAHLARLLYRTCLKLSRVTQDPGGSNYTWLRAERRGMLARRTITTVPPALPEALAQYRSDLLSLISSCQGRKQRMLFLTQPTLYATNMQEALSGLLWEHTKDAAYSPGVLAHIIDAYNATLLAVCGEQNVDCIDLAGKLPKDTSTFYDDCHFNISGCERIAEILAEYFKPRLGPGLEEGVDKRGEAGARQHDKEAKDKEGH